MTQAERLIRQLCAAKLQQIVDAERTLLKTVPTKIPWKDTPPSIRSAVSELRQIEMRKRELQKRLKKHGFSTYNAVPGRAMQLEDNGATMRGGITKAATEKREGVNRAQTQAIISSMGQPPEKVKIVLEELQKALRKV